MPTAPAAQTATPATKATATEPVPEKRAARMVRELYGASYQTKSPATQDAPEPNASAGLRETETDTSATVASPDRKEGISDASPAGKDQPAPTVASRPIHLVKNEEATGGPAPVAAQPEVVDQTVTPTATVAGETMLEKGSTGPAKLHPEGVGAAAGVEPAKTDQPAEKVEPKLDAASVKVASAPAGAKSGSFGDAGNKEQHEQKSQAKEVTQAQPVGIGTQITAPVDAPAAEVKGAKPETALHQSILSQIKDGAVTHDRNGNGQISIRLNPGELGELKIQVRMEENRVHVEVQADNKMVKDLLLSNLDSLKETLANKNFTMEGFDVSTGARDSFNNSNNPLSDGRENGQRFQGRSPRLANYADPEPARVNYLTGDVNNLLDVRF